MQFPLEKGDSQGGSQQGVLGTRVGMPTLQRPSGGSMQHPPTVAGLQPVL